MTTYDVDWAKNVLAETGSTQRIQQISDVWRAAKDVGLREARELVDHINPREKPIRQLQISELRWNLDTLRDAVDLWETRDDTKAQPEVTRAGGDAVKTIDTLVHHLHVLRNELFAEIRQSNDAAAVQADALLERLRKERADSPS